MIAFFLDLDLGPMKKRHFNKVFKPVLTIVLCMIVYIARSNRKKNPNPTLRLKRSQSKLQQCLATVVNNFRLSLNKMLCE